MYLCSSASLIQSSSSANATVTAKPKLIRRDCAVIVVLYTELGRYLLMLVIRTTLAAQASYRGYLSVCLSLLLGY